jgi:hypothetical protein
MPNSEQPDHPPSDEVKLSAFKIVEEARTQFLTWLKWTFGLGALFLGLFGLKGYSDWTAVLDAQKKELDSKIRDQVDENLRLNYKVRADEVLDSAVKARAEIAVSSRTLADLQSRSQEMELGLERFRDKLVLLERQAEGKTTEFTSKLDRIAADFESPAGQSNQRIKEQKFLKRSREYATKLALTLPEPRVVFREDPSVGNVLAMYDTKANVYVVSPSKLDSPALAEYSALMGRFFEKNRELLKNVGKPAYPDIQLWQGFRQSIVNYLLITDGLQSKPEGRDEELAIYRMLMVLEKKAGAASTRKLAVALLQAFDRDWRTANFQEKVLEVNEKVQALPNEDLKDALRRP